jgi:small GTP-binding protein
VIPLTAKVCIVGDFAVGKTSTVERFVNNHFSEKYLTTVGVKIDTKEIELPDRGVRQKLVIWDVSGKDRFGDIEFAYLRGASGLIYVADGTRSATITVANDLRRQFDDRYGERPFVLLLNKSDLESAWDVSEAQIARLRDDIGDVYVTSAKTGDQVGRALTSLAASIADRELAAST